LTFSILIGIIIYRFIIFLVTFLPVENKGGILK